jgi:hypothetical protein
LLCTGQHYINVCAGDHSNCQTMKLSEPATQLNAPTCPHVHLRCLHNQGIRLEGPAQSHTTTCHCAMSIMACRTTTRDSACQAKSATRAQAASGTHKRYMYVNNKLHQIQTHIENTIRWHTASTSCMALHIMSRQSGACCST